MFRDAALMSKLDAATRRRIAVDAEADPRTVDKVVDGKPVRSLAFHRILRALKAAGIAAKPGASEDTSVEVVLSSGSASCGVP